MSASLAFRWTIVPKTHMRPAEVALALYERKGDVVLADDLNLHGTALLSPAEVLSRAYRLAEAEPLQTARESLARLSP